MSLDSTDDLSTLIAWRHQAITWTSVHQDIWHHMALLGPNELTDPENFLWSHNFLIPQVILDQTQ